MHNSGYNTHNHTYYYPWLLQQLYAYKQQTGTQLIDVLTVHCYNALPGSNDDSLSGQQARNRETRILWDPTFQDPSWYGDIGINGRILNWIPTLKAMVNQYHPGLQIGCTEYNWGDEPNLNGATTQADVLGIYGREGLDLATRWTVAKNTGTTPATYYVTYLASQIYRNYDGNNSTFGDVSVSANTANPDNLSAFASTRTSDGVLTIMTINKQQGSTPVTLSLANFATTGTAQAWQINSASQASIARLADIAVSNNSITTTVPSQSITLFVIPAGAITTPPSAPTGLAATVGNGSVTLTWTAAGGATSYAVKRASVSGGPYLTVGTPATTTYTDSGLSNGATYYYVVSGANQAGASGNSSEVAATPIVPPAFTSSAIASPNPVAQGEPTTITATITDTSGTLTNGIVQILIVDAGGNTAASQTFNGQNFSTGQTQKYPLAFSPAVSGSFRVRLGVFSASWQRWHWNDAAASVTVTSSLTFTSSATATPSSVARGTGTSITATVTDAGTASLSNANIEVQVFNGAGNAVSTNVWSGQNFTGGQSHQYTYTWNVLSTQATGAYTVMIGVFDAGWATNYYWDSNGATIAVTASQALLFVPIAPCRIADTRDATGAFGAPAISPGGSRDFIIPDSACSIPATAQAYSLNVAVVPATTLGYLTLWPAGMTRPVASTLNSLDGRIKSNAAIVPAGTDGAVSVFASDATNVILDINGYFVPASDPTGLAFYPTTPCRITDTRTAAAPLGGPSLGGGTSRTFPILSSTCGLPATAQAYSLNFAAVPGGHPLGYLTAWPTGQTKPTVASLNAPTGTVVANAAIVKAGTSGSVDIFASDATDLAIDINGYFAPMATGGMSLYGVTPCRVVDTRQPAGSPAITSLDVGVSASACGIPSNAQAHVLSVTVVPPAPLGYLTLWPQGQERPGVSTLNALDAAITSNLAIVPTANGWISAFASDLTHLIVDISGYFGQ